METIARTVLLRSQLYAVLARGFAVPPRTLSDWQSQTRQLNVLTAVLEKVGGLEAVVPSLWALARARTKIAAEEKLEQLCSDHLELFGNLHSQRVPPYETEFTGEGDFQKNQQLADLMGFYRAFGLELHGREGSRERPDHIAVELEFLHFLCWKEANAREGGIEEHRDVCFDARRKFLGDHLGRWAEAFARGVEKTAPDGYFLALAALLKRVVEQDAHVLGVKLEPITSRPPRPMEAEPISCGAETSAPLVQIRGGNQG